MPRQVQKRRFQGLAPYMFSILLILLPAFLFYFYQVQSQTNYHESRNFRALGEIARMMDNNLGMLRNLFRTDVTKDIEEAGKDLEDAGDRYLKVRAEYRFTQRKLEKALKQRADLRISQTEGRDELARITKADIRKTSETLKAAELGVARAKRIIGVIEENLASLKSDIARIDEELQQARAELKNIEDRLNRANDSNRSLPRRLIRYLEQLHDSISKGGKELQSEIEKTVTSTPPPNVTGVCGGADPKPRGCQLLDAVREIDQKAGAFRAEFSRKIEGIALFTDIDPGEVSNLAGFRAFKESLEKADRLLKQWQGEPDVQHVALASILRVTRRFERAVTTQMEDIQRRRNKENSDLSGLKSGVEEKISELAKKKIAVNEALKTENDNLTNAKNNFIQAVGIRTRANAAVANMLSREAEIGAAVRGNLAGIATELIRVETVVRDLEILKAEQFGERSQRLQEVRNLRSRIDNLRHMRRDLEEALLDEALKENLLLQRSELPSEEIHCGENAARPYVMRLVRDNRKIEFTDCSSRRTIIVPIEDLFGPAKSRTEFEHVIVANRSGDILFNFSTGEVEASADSSPYEEKIGGLNYTNARHILEEIGRQHMEAQLPAESKEKEETSPGEKSHATQGHVGSHSIFGEMKIAGRTNLVFIRPFISDVPLQAPDKPHEREDPDKKHQLAENPPPGEWFVIGIADKSRFDGRTFKISLNFLGIFSLLMVLGIIGLPLIKMVSMSTRDSLSGAGADLVVMSTALVFGLVSLLLLDIFFYSHLEAGFDRTAEKISNDMRRNFRGELAEKWHWLQFSKWRAGVMSTDEFCQYIVDSGRKGEKVGKKATRLDANFCNGAVDGADTWLKALISAEGGESSKLGYSDRLAKIYPEYFALVAIETDGGVIDRYQPGSDQKSIRRSDPLSGKTRLTYFPAFTTSFFTNDKGARKGAMVNFVVRKYPSLNVFDRPYFQRANKRNVWSWNGKDEAAKSPFPKGFFIHRIIRYSDGQKSTTLAVPLGDGIQGEACQSKLNQAPAAGFDRARICDLNLTVAAVGGRLQTFFAPVLPPGFQFAGIEDATGMVLYDTDDSRSLVENFFSETDENASLHAAIAAHKQMLLTGRYHGQKTRFFTHPIKDTSWSLPVFYDLEVPQTLNFNIMLVAAGEFIAYIFFLGLLVLLSIALGSKDHWSWVWPDRTHPERYLMSAILILPAIVVMALGVYFASGWVLVWLVLLNSLYCISVHYMASTQDLNPKETEDGETEQEKSKNEKSKKKALLKKIKTLLNPITILGGLKALLKKIKTLLNPITILGGLLLLAPLWELLSGNVLKAIPPLLMFAFYAAALVAIRKYGRPIAGRVKPWLDNLEVRVDPEKQQELWETKTYVWDGKELAWSAKFGRLFVGAGFIFCIGVVVLPAIAFFKDARSFNEKVFFEYGRQEIASGMDERRKQLRRHAKILQPKFDWNSDEAEFGFDEARKYRDIYVYRDILYRGPIGSDMKTCDQLEDITCLPLQKIADGKWPTELDARSLNEEYVNVRDHGLAAWMTKRLPPYNEHAAKMHHAIQYAVAVEGGGLASRSWPLQMGFANGIGIALGAILFGVALFLFLKALSNRLLGLGIPAVSSLRRPNPTGYFRMLLYSDQSMLPDLGAERELRKDQKGKERYEVDMLQMGFVESRELKAKIKAEKSYFVVTNLAAVAATKRERIRALEAMERLCAADTKHRVIVIAEVSPLYRLVNPDLYPEMREMDDKDLPEGDEVYRWSSVLSRFAKEYQPLPKDDLVSKYEKDPKATLLRECGAFPTLSEVKMQIEEAIKSGILANKEQVIEHVGTSAGAFYRRLWSLCTWEERLLLYQLASDKRVNTRNIEIIEHLLRRGYIRRSPSLCITNKSFARFILSAESPEEIRRWAKEVERSVWSSLKVPIIVALLVIAAFVVNANSDEFDAVLTTVTGAVAALPLLIRGLGMFRGGSSQS
jgi:hypothetical protein